MNAITFMHALRNAEMELIARFIGESHAETVKLAEGNQLEERLDAAYASMGEAERAKFEGELGFNASSTTPSVIAEEKPPFWAEIKYDHHDETDGFIVAFVDAWKTSFEDEADEEGEVIAKVIGANLSTGKPSVYVSYQNVIAMVDVNAQEAIQAATKEVLEALAQPAQ